MMDRVAFYTLGCKVNQYETEAMKDLFIKAGYTVTDFDQKADIYVINTCTVTNISDRKSRQMIRRAKRMNPDALVAVTGCYAQVFPEEVRSMPEVDIILGTHNRREILNCIEKAKNEKVNEIYDIMKVKEYEDMSVEGYSNRTRAYIKIQDGCNQYCSYCIIPYARGPVRSRQPQSVMEEVLRLSEKGYREIVLTGIHIASYGEDLNNISLIDIIGMIHEVKGIDRIRLSSLEPGVLTDYFIERLKNLPKVCPHFHISLQSGSDSVLKRMRRRYTTGEYKKIVDLIRNNIRDVAITTDIMVGFPGETEEEFKQSYDFVKDIGFSRLHVFKFSPRKGTPAAEFEGQVPDSVKEERSRKMIGLGDELQRIYHKKFIGRTLPVLIETESVYGEHYYEGYTPNYIKVVFKCDKINEIVNVKLRSIQKDFMLGEVI